MRVGLVCSTLGHLDTLRRFLLSLAAQREAPDVHLVVVDQSASSGCRDLVEEVRGAIAVTLCHSARGLSLGRNVGLKHLGDVDVVGFPDDDCWYDDELLHRVVSTFAHHPGYDGLLTAMRGELGELVGPRWPTSDVDVTATNVWRCASSGGLFLRSSTLAALGEFREDLGVGAVTPWRAGEDLEMVLRAALAGYRIRFLRDLTVRHPAAALTGDRADIVRKARDYGRGYGRALAVPGVPNRTRALQLIRPVGGAWTSVLKGDGTRARFHWAVALGRTEGLAGRCLPHRSGPRRTRTPSTQPSARV